MSELKKGDIVTHKSEPEICGVICEIEKDGYIVDYSISMPPTLADKEDLVLIKSMEPTPEKTPHQITKQPKRHLTDGFTKVLYRKD